MKHRHKWVLEYVDAGTCGRGLLWQCECGSCIEWSKKKDYEKAYPILVKIINDLWKL